jgi:hypothetical protein
MQAKSIDMRKSDSVADTIRFHLDTMRVMILAGREEYAQNCLDNAYAALDQIPDLKFVSVK